MAGGDVQIAIPNGGAPTSKTVIGQTAILPKAVNATFDGTGAATPFAPCLVITGKEGFELARIPGPTVAAGASAKVSWFPRVGGQAQASGGIDFDKDNEGGYLSVVTHNTVPFSPFVGMFLDDASGGGIHIEAANGGPVQILAHANAANVEIQAGHAGVIFLGEGATGLSVMNPGGGNRLLWTGGSVFLALPNAPGPSGSLWNNGGVVQVAP